MQALRIQLHPTGALAFEGEAATLLKDADYITVWCDIKQMQMCIRPGVWDEQGVLSLHRDDTEQTRTDASPAVAEFLKQIGLSTPGYCNTDWNEEEHMIVLRFQQGKPASTIPSSPAARKKARKARPEERDDTLVLSIQCPQCGFSFPASVALAPILQAERQRIREEQQQLGERELELRVNAERQKVRQAALLESDEAHRLKLREKDEVILAASKQIEELKRKLEQGSIQRQGEAMQVELGSRLRAAFPGDQIQAIAKGRAGADFLQVVCGFNGTKSGSIIHEVKSAARFQSEWLQKVQNDQRAAGANFAVITTKTMPAGSEDASFLLKQGVWISSLRSLLPLTTVLRVAVIGIAMAAARAQTTGKAQEVYGYVTSGRFSAQIGVAVQALLAMREGINNERKTMEKAWSKREHEVDLAMMSLSAVWGDLNAILGGALPFVPGLSLPDVQGDEAA